MSKCDFTFELERADATFRPGERVKGKVTFRGLEDFEYRRLLLVREWRTHGRGNRDSGGQHEVELAAAGMSRAGDTETFTFDIEMPAGPYTYRGHYINVDWYLEARADIARALDPKGERELVLLPSAQPVAEYFIGDVALDGTTDAIDRMANTQRKVQTFVFGGVAAFLLLFGLYRILGSGLLNGTFDSNNAGGLILGVLLLVPGIWLGYRQVRNSVAQRRLGAIALTVTPRQVRPGETINVRIHSATVTDATIDRARLTLAGKEIVTRGTGTDRTTHTHVLHEEHIELLDLPHAVRHGPMDVSGDVTLPADAGYSFRASDNRVYWSITARLSLPGWADWQDEVEIVVRP